MRLRRLTGVLILALVMGGLFGMTAAEMGLLRATVAWAFAVVLTGFLSLGAWLIA
jgi:hypothetical protein